MSREQAVAVEVRRSSSGQSGETVKTIVRDSGKIARSKGKGTRNKEKGARNQNVGGGNQYSVIGVSVCGTRG